jgi:tetratricopeptide (TPR) repeat protein
MPLAIQEVQQALAINPNLAAGQLSLAASRLWYEWNWAGAETAYRRALELTPGDSWPRYGYSVFLSLRGRHEEAIAEAQRAAELDPVSPMNSLGVINAFSLARRFDEAIECASRAITLEPSFFSTYWALALALAGTGRYAEAVATLERGRPFAHGDANLEGFLGWAYGLNGEPEKARAIADQLEARRRLTYVGGTHIALVYQGLGDMDQAMRWYQQAYSDRATDCSAYARAPQFDAARLDSRFQALVRSIESGGQETMV